MKSLILASGFGTRLYPLTISKAKGLLEYRGKALITHLVEKIPRDIDILVNTNKKFEADFRSWQDTISRKVTLCVEPVFSEEQKFGAIGSLDYWIKNKNIADDLLVMASDNYFEFDLGRFIAGYNGKNALVAVYHLEDKSKASQFGVVQLEGQRITAFEEKPAEPKGSLIATACYLLPQRLFPLISQFCAEGKKDNLGSFIAYLMDKDEVYAHAFGELWFDAGSTGLPFLSV
ncbi:nucleotidyltransferase family protein [Chloroflexota bacterium]